MAANEITVLNEEITELHKEREAIDQQDPKYAPNITVCQKR